MRIYETDNIQKYRYFIVVFILICEIFIKNLKVIVQTTN